MPDQVIKIILLIRVPDGTTAEVVACGSAELPDQAEAAAALRDDPPMPRSPTHADVALAALRKLGVDHPENVLRRHAAPRIIEVCTYAIEQTRQQKLHNPPAWVMSALRRGYTIPKEVGP